MNRPALTSLIALLLTVTSACGLGNTEVTIFSQTPLEELGGEGGYGGSTPGGGGPVSRCALGQTYRGFGGTVLEAGRVDADIGVERQRVKPFSALTTEYARVLNTTPALLNSSATAFDSAPVRWFMEAKANAVSLYTAYRIGFQGCLTLTNTDARYDVLPSGSTAESECRGWARKFWSRDADANELAACVKTAMEDTVNEGNNAPTTPRRRWAYTCAAVLTSAGFLTF